MRKYIFVFLCVLDKRRWVPILRVLTHQQPDITSTSLVNLAGGKAPRVDLLREITKSKPGHIRQETKAEIFLKLYGTCSW
jgi:hypothetical protein